MNFKELDDLIHSGVKEIVLDADIVLDDGEESDYKEGIKLDVDDLIIDGNGHTIDAKGSTRIFYCTSKNIILKNITLKNGNIEDDGGAINNAGELTVSESTFTGNTAQGAFSCGGAIYNTGELTVSDSTLTENTAQNGGGAIYNDGGTLTVSDSTLEGNTAHGGGAIRNDEGTLTVSDSTLEGNTAEYAGGAIYNWEGTLTVSDSTLEGNTAHGGGAIRNDEGMLTVSDSIITGNTAEYAGGAIYLHKDFKKYESNNCTFKDNNPDDVYEDL